MEIKVIKEKLQELAKRDRHFTVFGSETHNYKNNPVSIKEIEIFEQKYKFRLPENFRLFLHEIGYGAGPNYGIRSLKEISRYIENWFPVDYISKPIELTLYAAGIRSKNPFDENKVHPAKPFPLTQNNIDYINLRLQNEDWEFLGDCAEIANHPLDGNILICHPGCHYEIVLVTSGELFGTVWNVECNGENSSWLPEGRKDNDNQVQTINFENWYEEWLDFSFSKFKK